MKMIHILIIVTITINLYSVDIAKLQQNKIEHKLTEKNQKKINTKDDKGVIVYSEIDVFEIFSLEEKYGLKLHNCVARRVCIFNSTKIVNLNSIKSKYRSIESIKYSTKYNFKQY